MLHIVKKLDKYSAICQCSNCQSDYSVKSIYDAKKSQIGDLCTKCKTAITNMGEITQDKLLKAFDYDPILGTLTYRKTTASGCKGELSTHAHSGGYLSVCINRKQYLAHRIIHLMMTRKWPDYIDHINHNRQDNSWANLRSVEQIDNNRNCSSQSNSKTNILGVSFHKPTQKYRAYIWVNKKQKHLGLFESIDAAKAARENATIQYGYHANHGQ